MAVELANDAICEDASKLLSKLSLMSHEAAEKKIEMPGETLLKLGNVTINETASLAEKTEEVIVTKMASNITQLDEKEAEKTIEGMSDEMIEKVGSVMIEKKASMTAKTQEKNVMKMVASICGKSAREICGKDEGDGETFAEFAAEIAELGAGLARKSDGSDQEKVAEMDDENGGEIVAELVDELVDELVEEEAALTVEEGDVTEADAPNANTGEADAAE